MPPQGNLQLYYPFKPYIITQRWGNANPAYAAQFNNPAFKLHNGIDANVGGHPVSGWPVYCPAAGFKVQQVDFAPKGGGNEIWLISKTPLQVFDQLCYVQLVLCHAEKILVPEGYEPEVGELLMLADNTGFSTGPHTHFGMYRHDALGNKIDHNNAEGSFDPSLFFTGKAAVDVASLSTLVRGGLRLYSAMLK